MTNAKQLPTITPIELLTIEDVKKLEKAMYGEPDAQPITNTKISVLKMRSGGIKEGLELQLKSNSIAAIKELATQMQKLNQEIEDILMEDHNRKIKTETTY